MSVDGVTWVFLCVGVIFLCVYICKSEKTFLSGTQTPVVYIPRSDNHQKLALFLFMFPTITPFA